MRVVTAALVSLLLLIPSAAGAAEKAVTLKVTDRVAGGTIRYLGGYGLVPALRHPRAAKFVHESDVNITKFWVGYGKSNCEGRGEFYGPDFKELAIRQVTKFPETIDWAAELSGSAKRLADFEARIKTCVDNGIQPMLEVNNKLKGMKLRRRFFWRYTFLLNYYLNKVKGYNVILWNFGSEHGRLGPEQLDVGSDAVRASEKLTGVPVLVGGCGDDGDIDIDYETVLKSRYIQRADALSFHSFNFRNDFPKLGVPGVKSANGNFREPYDRVLRERFDGLQKKFRPGKKLLPYWDTGWYWRDSKSNRPEKSKTYVREETKDLIPFEYLGRCMHACETRATVFIYCSFYGARASSAVHAPKGGGLVIKPLYHAMRMMTRANLGAAERLELEGEPGDEIMQALATRSGTRLYLTCLSRLTKDDIKLTIRGLDAGGSRKFAVHRLDDKHRDTIVERGTIAPSLSLDLPPLSALQVVIGMPTAE
jgi:hypothetical protein